VTIAFRGVYQNPPLPSIIDILRQLSPREARFLDNILDDLDRRLSWKSEAEDLRFSNPIYMVCNHQTMHKLAG